MRRCDERRDLRVPTEVFLERRSPRPRGAGLNRTVDRCAERFDVLRHASYTRDVIRSFRDKDVEALFHDISVRRFRAIGRAARRKLLYLHLSLIHI